MNDEETVNITFGELQFYREELKFLTNEEFRSLPKIYRVLDADNPNSSFLREARFTRERGEPEIFLPKGARKDTDLAHELGHFFLGHDGLGEESGLENWVRKELQAIDWAFRRTGKPRDLSKDLDGLMSFAEIDSDRLGFDGADVFFTIKEELDRGRYSPILKKGFAKIERRIRRSSEG